MTIESQDIKRFFGKMAREAQKVFYAVRRFLGR